MLTHNRLPRSTALYERARRSLPGGVTRATVAAKPVPIYAEHGEGPRLFDVDGNAYLDLVNNYTALIHGHAFAPVVEAVQRQIGLGACFANPTEAEIEMAEVLTSRVPAAETVRFVTTGTEALMFAVKAARAYSGRTRVAKLEGAYHGGYDVVETSEDAGPDTWGPASDPTPVRYADGTPQSVLDDNVIIHLNDVENTLTLLERTRGTLACIVVDPMPSRCGLIPLEPAFVDALHAFARSDGALIIADEVLNFRRSYAGASAAAGLQPDLLTIGKIIGGGLPLAAIAGRAVVMDVFDGATGPPTVRQGGTFAANPVSLAAGLAAMAALDRPAFDRLNGLGDRLRAGLREAIAAADLPLSVTGEGSLYRLHARTEAPRTYRKAHPRDAGAVFARLVWEGLLERGISAPESSCCSLSTAMTDRDIDTLIGAYRDLFADAEVRSAAERAVLT